MSQSFTTDHIPAPDRQAAWLSNAQQICGDCKFLFPRKSPFHGSISRRKLAELEMTLFSSSAVSFNKFPVPNFSPENRACIVITQLQGLRRYSQNGKVAVLRKGDATLIDSATPWSSDCAGDCARLYLRIPQLLLEKHARLTELPFVRRISGDSGLGSILFHLSTSLYQQAESLNPAEGFSAMEGYLRILAACVGGNQHSQIGASRALELTTRITNYIENHLTESALGPIEIAAALGISVRHVHRVFSNHESTVADWIRTQRLKHCRTDLCDPRLHRKSITEIAFYWGFNDSAHFSHAFKKEYRICPRTFRSRVMLGLPVPSDSQELHKFPEFAPLSSVRAS
ncbi:MAG TPA: helix-turn-helix domain-containing protein [Candidatus Acidoferrum sp.]